ncbi:MAG: putative selenate ABC transporter substrate-binding protein [Candidatus Krumholzibacteriia bacterium]|nr:putative selenate ABC transporter substrate-binding protein [Candidatus Latescibacterota bacterium]MCB9515674.1 putative selenate ABC transporter substrate-binding protein [Candidatus Latescibacterota bacterium]
MRNSLRLLLVPILLTLGLANCGQKQEAAKKELLYTAIPDQNSTELIEKFKPFSDHLSQVLGVPVRYVPARDYQASVEMFRNGDVQLAWFGGLTGVQARAAVPGASAIAQGAADPTYYSYFIANASTGLEKSDDFPMGIEDLAFTFGSESSTSGRLMPEHFIREATGKAPSDFFSKPVSFSGSHDKTCELVASGQFQAGVVNYKVYDRRVAEGTTDPNVVRVIWQTPQFADYNWTAHPSLDATFGAGFTMKLQKAMTDISDPALLAALPREKLIPASNAEFEGIREVAVQLGMLR